ncbi:hypothetical protein KBK19_13025 [Microvirga sp. STR05]|uniref:DUF4149 domain-containing protein n=1 Tax=Hymenobacter duratus TaxID=2771356 RepID=A0ABR8JGG3_9BACT|nr:hypothetical protein [Hymenobacter duratus]MBD2715958.1 hypothetical protein [Hymenobacter duratus]MBR7950872.1 hypothetical protein [Microvirga sp. STR05]
MPRFHATAALLLVLSLFVWAGLVAGISFLEAPLKFTAPGITVPLGLGIGRIVFSALNKLELLLAAVAVVSGFYLRVPAHIGAMLGIVSGVLLLQTLWLLPALDVRALALLAGHPAPPNSLHKVYIGLEVVKLLTLLLTGSWAFRWALQAARGQTLNRRAQQLA